MAKNRKRLTLNRERRKFLGVCAGVADYLEVEAWAVRLLFVVAVLMGAWFLIPVYFVFYFCLDGRPGDFKDKVSRSSTAKHFRNVDYKKKLYRNKEDAKVLGVCAGIADYLEVDVTVVRLIVFVLLFVAGPIPWLAYIAAYFVLDVKPEGGQYGPQQYGPQEGMAEEGPMPEGSHSKRREFRHCMRKFGNLQARLARMEAYVTSSHYELHRQFRDIT